MGSQRLKPPQRRPRSHVAMRAIGRVLHKLLGLRNLLVVISGGVHRVLHLFGWLASLMTALAVGVVIRRFAVGIAVLRRCTDLTLAAVAAAVIL